MIPTAETARRRDMRMTLNGNRFGNAAYHLRETATEIFSPFHSLPNNLGTRTIDLVRKIVLDTNPSQVIVNGKNLFLFIAPTEPTIPEAVFNGWGESDKKHALVPNLDDGSIDLIGTLAHNGSDIVAATYRNNMCVAFPIENPLLSEIIRRSTIILSAVEHHEKDLSDHPEKQRRAFRLPVERAVQLPSNGDIFDSIPQATTQDAQERKAA